MKKSLLNSLIIGLIFSLILILSTYWSRQSIEGLSKWPWTTQFLVMWIVFALLIFIVDRSFDKK